MLITTEAKNAHFFVCKQLCLPIRGSEIL